LKFWAEVFKDPIKFIKNEFITLGEQIKVIFTNAFAKALDGIRFITKAIDKVTGLKLSDLIPKLETKPIPVTQTQKLVFENVMQFAGGGFAKKMAENLGTYFGTKPKVADPLDKIRTGGKPPEVPDDPKQKDDKEKKKKQDKKSESLLGLIVQNTQKANELTLRNMTYGGGQLAAQGISQVQMASNRSVKSPQINASNDITRGVEKIVRGYTNSNNLNFSFRRS
jgi:hypothetical protein